MLETQRLTLIPCTENELRLGRWSMSLLARRRGLRYDAWAAEHRWLHSRVFAAKAGLIRETPGAWLLCTAWLMVETATGNVIGDLGFKGVPLDGEVEIGYGLQRSYRNKGLMSEAVGELCRFAFAQTERRVTSIAARTAADNLASHRVLQKNGFRRDGTAGKYLRWKLVKP